NPMTDLVLNAAPLLAMVRPRLEAWGRLLAQAMMPSRKPACVPLCRRVCCRRSSIMETHCRLGRRRPLLPGRAMTPRFRRRASDARSDQHDFSRDRQDIGKSGVADFGAATIRHAGAGRAGVGADVFLGPYHLSSKNDDDLPLVR